MPPICKPRRVSLQREEEGGASPPGPALLASTPRVVRPDRRFPRRLHSGWVGRVSLADVEELIENQKRQPACRGAVPGGPVASCWHCWNPYPRFPARLYRHHVRRVCASGAKLELARNRPEPSLTTPEQTGLPHAGSVRLVVQNRLPMGLTRIHGRSRARCFSRLLGNLEMV